MSTAEIDKVTSVASDIVNKMLEEEKKQIENSKVFSKEEELSDISNELNKEEFDLFKQRGKVSSEGLDNAYSDSFGGRKHKEQKKYSEMVKTLSDESVNKVETLYEENIYGGMGDAPKEQMHHAELSEIDYAEISKIDEKINKYKNIQTPEIDLEKEVESHSKDMNDFIENEVVNEKENISYLTEDELNGILNEHFEKVEAVLHEYEGNNINADTFKDKLQSLSNHVKENARSSFKKVINKTTQPVKDLKRNATNKIDGFINKVNDKLKDMTQKIDEKINNKETEINKDHTNFNTDESKEITNTQPSYEKKIEKTLRNDPDLFKKIVAVTQINAMKNHLEKSKDSLSQLNEINKDDEVEQYKVNDMKKQLTNHIDGMEKELYDLEQSHHPEQTMEELNEQSKEQDKESENEQENEKEQSKDKDSKIEREEVMER